jgi:hypothetical protein
MENNHITALQDKIIEALKIASQKLIETKKRNKQKIAVSINGKIEIISPE